MPRVTTGDNGEVELYYESVGEGIPFVLHAHDHLSYMPFQVPFFSRFYRVIVFDRRGTGRSSEPPGPWTATDLARDVKNLMDALDIPKAIVGGISLGGVVSSVFGLDYPDRAHALIVGGTVPRMWPLGDEWIDQQLAFARGEAPIIVNQPRSYDWEAEGPPTQAPGFAETQFGQYLATLKPRMGSKEALVSMLNVLKGWDQSPRYPELQKLDIPALVIVGGNEPQKTIEYSYEWSLQFKRGEFVILPNTHHGAGRENPIGWNAAVLAFLQRNGL